MQNAVKAPAIDDILARRGILEVAQRFEWTAWQMHGQWGWLYPVYQFDGNPAISSNEGVEGKTVIRWKNSDSTRKPKCLWDEKRGKGNAKYYCGPNLAAEIAAQGGVLIIVSGEPDLLVCHAAGLRNCLCWFGEKAMPDSLAEDLTALGVSTVLLYPDLDETGIAAAAAVWKKLHRTPITLRVFALPGQEGSKYDLNKLWMDVGFHIDDFLAALDACPEIEDIFLHEPAPEAPREQRELPAAFYEAIEDALAIPGYKPDGWSKHFPCPFKNHQHDDKQPGACWHGEKHILRCFKCGQTWLAVQVGQQLNIDWRTYLPQDRPRQQPLPSSARPEAEQPFDEYSERAILALALRDSRVFAEVSHIITDQSFCFLRHRHVWAAMTRCDERRELFDPAIIAGELERFGHLDAIGGKGFVDQLARTDARRDLSEQYAINIAKAVSRRTLLDAAGVVEQIAKDQTIDLEKAIELAQSSVMNIKAGGRKSRRTSLVEQASRIYDDVEYYLNNPDAERGIKTGYIDLDRKIEGIMNEELLVIAARPSMGKTAFMLNLMRRLGGKYPLACASLEMSADALTARMIGMAGELNSKHVINRKLGLDDKLNELGQVTEHSEFTRFVRGSASLEKLQHIDIDDTPGMSLMAIRNYFRVCKHELDIRAGFIDYMGLIGGQKTDKRHEDVGTIVRGLKDLCRELHIPLFVLAQINREAEGKKNKRPLMSHLAESGTIEQVADHIWTLYRDEYYNPDSTEHPNEIELNILKNRNGQVGMVRFYFDKPTQLIEDLA